MSAADHGRRARFDHALALLGASALTACAPIVTHSEVRVRPRQAPTLDYGEAELARTLSADYVQLGGRVLVELREREQCVAIRHLPVLRVEQVERRSQGFVAWDFTLGVAAGGFSALAFARPQAFTKPLISTDGRVVYDYSGAYVVGSIFAAVSVGLLTAGIVNAVRARDTVTYADAFELDTGEPHPCPGAGEGRAMRDRSLTLFVADGVLEAEARSDAEGRARFELRPWPPELEPPATGLAPAVLEIRADEDHPDAPTELLELELRVPFAAMTDAHTGRATAVSQANAQPEPEGPARPSHDGDTDEGS